MIQEGQSIVSFAASASSSAISLGNLSHGNLTWSLGFPRLSMNIIQYSKKY